MAEHGLQGEVIGVAFDGTGYGLDGAIWGGEFLVAGYGHFHRAAHLRYVPLPGGDQAIRHPWRSAVTHALDAGCDPYAVDALRYQPNLSTIAQMVDGRVNSPWASSTGRLFDAAAALMGIRASVAYEGQAAMELEWLATAAPTDGAYPFEIIRQHSADSPLEIDTRPIVRALVDDMHRGRDRPAVARRFQSTVVELLVMTCIQIRRESGLQRVVLSGGTFLNALLARKPPGD